MPRATNAPASRRRKKRILKRTKGFVGGRRKLIRTATETLNRAMAFAFKHRRAKKREFRALWITRIGIAAKQHGLSYNAFISGLKKAGVALNRKMLAGIAVSDPAAFAALVSKAKGA
ncbi:MAG: 50S ribosomal protein L20 [bacterium]|nr:50S ribosomal protein L20 [bacterium]